MKGYALSSNVPGVPITEAIATSLLENLRRVEAMWVKQLTDPQDANARMWGCAANVELRWSAEMGAVDPDPNLCVVQLVETGPPGTPAGDAAYHTEDAQGRPLCLIFYVVTGAEWVSAAAHEIAESRVDGPCVAMVAAPDGTQWALEVADPVQGSDYAEVFGGPLVCNVVGPRYFGLQQDGPLDVAGAVTAPFQQLPSGYHESTAADGTISNVFGDRVSPEKRALVDRVGVRAGMRRRSRG